MYVCNLFVCLFVCIEVSITIDSQYVGIVSGENVTLECIPSHPDVELYWSYQTADGIGTVRINDVSELKFISDSPLLHQLVLPNASASDTGNYSCHVQTPLGVDIMVSQTITLTVLPGKSVCI